MIKLPRNVKKGDARAYRMAGPMPPVDPDIQSRAKGDQAPGILSGVAIRIGEIDSYWTVAAHDSKAFAPAAIRELVRSGAVLGAHDSRETPIGYFTSAKMVGRDLVIEGEYHSTPRAEEYKTIAEERLEAGKPVDLSIGFYVENYQWFESGKKLLEHLEKTGAPLDMYNAKAIKGHKSDIWLMSVDSVFEVSQVNFGAVPFAELSELRGGPEEEADEIEPGTKGQPITESELQSCEMAISALDSALRSSCRG